MRSALAALVDVAATAGLAYAGFRLALWATPCRTETDCFPLAPAVVLVVLLLVAAYFVVGWLVLRSSPGRRLFGIQGETDS